MPVVVTWNSMGMVHLVASTDPTPVVPILKPMLLPVTAERVTPSTQPTSRASLPIRCPMGEPRICISTMDLPSEVPVLFRAMVGAVPVVSLLLTVMGVGASRKSLAPPKLWAAVDMMPTLTFEAKFHRASLPAAACWAPAPRVRRLGMPAAASIGGGAGIGELGMDRPRP